MLCLSLFGFVELLGFVYLGMGVLYVAMWRVAYFRGLNSMGPLQWVHMAGAHFAMPQYAPIGTTYPACGYARSKMRKHGAYSTGFRTTSMG